MRGFLPWKAPKTIRFDNIDYPADTSTSLEMSPDGQHLWTIALDHTLRAWDIEKGTVAFHQDLAGDKDRDLQKPIEALLQPTLSQRLQIIPRRTGYVVATFSVKTRAFKLWDVRKLDGTLQGWEDLRSDVEFSPPIEQLGDATLWNLESFHFQCTSHHQWKLWILVRFGSQSQAYTNSFDLDDHSATLTRSWEDSWIRVDSGMASSSALKQDSQHPCELEALLVPHDAQTPSEAWSQYLFMPGRFTEATLETALVVYRRSLGPLGKERAAHLSDRSLRSRICELVGSSVSLGPHDEGAVNFERFENAVSAQWQIFNGVVKDLHMRREEVITMRIDQEESITWLICADVIAPLRACSELEVLWHNRTLLAEPHSLRVNSPLFQTTRVEDKLVLGQLFYAVDSFRQSLSPSFIHCFKSVLEAQTSERAKEDPLQAIEAIYNESGFSGQVNDSDYDKLTLALNLVGGFMGLDDDILVASLELFQQPQKGSLHKKRLTAYGCRMLIRGAEETLALYSEILIDLLLLVVFVMVELEVNDLADTFHGGEVFVTLMAKLEQVRLLRWLASTVIERPQEPEAQLAGISEPNDFSKPHRRSSVSSSITLLEHLFVPEWATLKYPSEPLQELLTYWCRSWVSGLPLDTDFETVASRIFGQLIISGKVDLAKGFLPFVPETPWALYLTARLKVSSGEMNAAALYFSAAAAGLGTLNSTLSQLSCSLGFAAVGKYVVPEELPSAEILDFEERECLNKGYARYYQHVVNVFEKAKGFSNASDFGQLAVQALESEADEDRNLKTDLLSRLFASAHKTSRFDLAFNALSQQSNLSLYVVPWSNHAEFQTRLTIFNFSRDSSLRALVQTLLVTSSIATLLSLPYTEDLASIADSVLSDLASKPPPAGPDTTSTHSPHKILFAFRLRRGDLRGAASCLWNRLQELRESQEAGFRGEDIDDEVAQCYLPLINTLSLMHPEQAWILTRPRAINGDIQKRRVVTLDAIRTAWQEELDRVSDVAAGRFALDLDWKNGITSSSAILGSSTGAGGSMEVDVSVS